MKKFLSLVLALVMTMSLVTISAGAKDFTDAGKIQYNEAIDVVSTIGIVDGYADGSFNPSATLTRGAAAKIICNLILGPTTAGALSADAAPYSDVPANSTFAGYIAYCQKEGIISGYADGTFKPGNTLTGYAFMKMLLGALGYDAEIEGYTGANWSINVAKRALNVGLDGGLVDDFNGTKAVTREEACLYAFNTLQADMVEYGDKTFVSVGDATVSVGGSKAKAVEWNNSADADGNIDGTARGDGYIQFAEQYFNKLVKDTTTTRDGFGRPATKWVYKGEKIGTYAEKADVTYAKSVKLSDIYADLGMSTKDETANLYENGELSATALTGEPLYDADMVVSKSNEAKLKDLGDTLTGNGSIVEVFRNEDTNHVDICVISVYVGEVVKTVAATKTKDAYVVIDNKTTVDQTGTLDDEFDTEAFEEDDMVAFTYSKADNEIKTVTKLESVTGTLSKRAVATSLTLGETEYKYAKNVAYGDGLTDDTSLVNKGEYTVYLDANGYVLYVDETEAAIDSYALVLAVGTTFDSDKAKLVFSDGTKKTVSTAKDYNGTLIAGDIVTYKVEADGDYKLTKKTNAINTWGTDVAGTETYDDNFVITKRDSAIAISSATVNNTAGVTTIYADSSTVFVIQKGTDDFKVYTGIKNVPNVTAGSNDTQVAFLCKDGVKATIVFVSTDAANVTSNSSDILFVAGNSRSDRIVDADDNSYYEYNAVINGKITTVKVDTTGSVADLKLGAKKDASGYYGFLYDNYSTDSDDLLQTATATFSPLGDVTKYYGIGVKKMSGEYSVRVNTAASNLLLTVAENANIFYVNDDGDISSITLSQVKTDGDDQVIYTMEDGEITNLFVIERS